MRFVHPVADAFGICLGERCACGKSHVPFRRGSEKISWERQLFLRVIPPARTKTTTGVDHARSSCAVSDWRSRGAWWRLYYLSLGALTHARLSSGSRGGSPASETTSGFPNWGAPQHGRSTLNRSDRVERATMTRTLGFGESSEIHASKNPQCGSRLPIHQMKPPEPEPQA